MNRRDFFRWLPAVPLLPAILSKFAAAPRLVQETVSLRSLAPLIRQADGTAIRGYGRPISAYMTEHVRETYQWAERAGFRGWEIIERTTWITERVP